MQDKFIRSLSAYCLAVFLVLCSWLSYPGAGLADTSFANAVDAPTSSRIETEAPSPERMEQFAQAYVQVLTLLSDREPELPAAETSADAAKIQESIEADAVAIIEKNGLTMPEYMEILGLASQDETFRSEVLGSIDAALQE